MSKKISLLAQFRPFPHTSVKTFSTSDASSCMSSLVKISNNIDILGSSYQKTHKTAIIRIGVLTIPPPPPSKTPPTSL